MEDRKITEKESLEIITSMITRTKERFIGDGNIMLMWGYLVAITTILVWIMTATTHQNAWNWLWFAIPIIGGTATPIMARRQQRSAGAVTYSDKITSRIWTLMGLSESAMILLCLGYQFIGETNCWSAMLAYTLTIAPFAEITQGFIIKENCLIAGGLIGLATGLVTICCIAGGIPLEAYWFLPLFIISFVAMMIVPGHILNHKAKHK